MRRITYTLTAVALTSVVPACLLDSDSLPSESDTVPSSKDEFDAVVLRKLGPNARIINATDNQQDAGGFCNARNVTVNTATAYGGWIDGNGPDTYVAAGHCTAGYSTFGVTRWCGDRNKSIASCTAGGVLDLKSFIIVDN